MSNLGHEFTDVLRRGLHGGIGECIVFGVGVGRGAHKGRSQIAVVGNGDEGVVQAQFAGKFGHFPRSGQRITPADVIHQGIGGGIACDLGLDRIADPAADVVVQRRFEILIDLEQDGELDGAHTGKGGVGIDIDDFAGGQVLEIDAVNAWEFIQSLLQGIFQMLRSQEVDRAAPAIPAGPSDHYCSETPRRCRWRFR